MPGSKPGALTAWLRPNKLCVAAIPCYCFAVTAGALFFHLCLLYANPAFKQALLLGKLLLGKQWRTFDTSRNEPCYYSVGHFY